MAQIGILPLGHVVERAGTPVAIAALVIGAVGSHLPRSIRKWSVRHRRVVADEWTPGQVRAARAGHEPRARGHREGADPRTDGDARLAD